MISPGYALEMALPQKSCQELLAPQPIDRRVRRTIAALHQAVLELLPEKPYDIITIQDIADRADVSRTAFYAHFSDKSALMEYIIDAVFERCLAVYDDTSGEVRVRQLCMATCDYFQQIFTQCRHARRMLDPLIQQRIGTRLKELLVCDFQRIADTGRAPLETVDITATVVAWSIYGSTLAWANSLDQKSAGAFVDENLAAIASAYFSWVNQQPVSAALV